MLIRIPRGWELPERDATPESLVMRRRSVLAGSGLAGARLAGVGLAGAGVLGARSATAQSAAVNPKFADAGRPLTAEGDATTYNNFYEFGTDKSIYRAAQRLPVDPWSIEIDGLVANPRKIALADLLKQVQTEQRVYRHRCVETWAMTVPWDGFPLAALVKLCEPKPEAKYIRFETLADQRTMPGLRLSYFNWPYVEGVTMAEGTNDLAFLATGMYGKAMPKQDGAPIRLVLPWKYGFKSIKSIVKVSFVDKQPMNFWQEIQPSEYGFWANVNPEVSHPRWSQATEKLLTSGDRVPTKIYNGYGEYVASLYTGMPQDKLFM